MDLQRKELLAAFLIGCLLGTAAGSRLQKSALHKFWEHRPDTQKIFNKFNRELNLDAPQQTAVKAIIEKHHKEMMSLEQESIVKFHAIRMAMRTDMKKVLHPDQQEKFRDMAARWDARHPLPENNSQPTATH